MVSSIQSRMPSSAAGSPAISSEKRARLAGPSSSAASRSPSFIITRGANSKAFSLRSGSKTISRSTAKSVAPRVSVSPGPSASAESSCGSIQTVPGAGGEPLRSVLVAAGSSSGASCTAPRSG